MNKINSLDIQQISSRNLGIRRKVFSASETEFFFLNKAYLNAYNQLLNGIRQRGGFFVLTSEAGIGKTLLLRKLASETSGNIEYVFCYSTNIDYDNLLTVIGDQLGIAVGESSLSNKITAFEEYLNESSVQGMSVVLLIDDAHHLNEDVLINLIALSGLKIKGDHALRIVLSGTPLLEEILKKARAQNGFPSDIVHVCLEPLTVIDVANYIGRQVKNAGVLDMDSLFPPPVIEKIARYTGGVPRLVNTLCERALSIIQLDKEAAVTIATVDEAASELMLQEKDIISGIAPVASLEAALPNDATRVAGSAQRPALDIDHLDEEIKKMMADPSVVDGAEINLDETISEPILDTAANPVTAVSFDSTRSGVANQLIQSIPSAFRNESKLSEESRKNLVETLFDDELEKTALIEVPDSMRLDLGRQKTFRLSGLQVLFIALLAGLAGGVGGIYFFYITSAEEPIVSSHSEPVMPAPGPVSAQQASITVPVPGGDKEAGLNPASAIESSIVSTPMLASPGMSPEPSPSGIAPEPSAESVQASPVEPPSISTTSMLSATAGGSESSAEPPSASSNSESPAEPPSASSAESRAGVNLQSPPLLEPAADTPSRVAEVEASSISSSLPAPATSSATPLVLSHMRNGDALLARGDVISARLFYEAAADVGFAAAMTAVGKTYDPVILGQLGIKGFRADPAKAAEWYLKAAQAGDPETAEHLEGLRNWFSNSPDLKEIDAKALKKLLR
ncbi:MAG TPA: AAA family ATPase [Candidatus Competibacter sp.]|nr:AAA family ATPase [Candidatus Competibacter sp.]